MTTRMIASYKGETEYDINGTRYAVRFRAFDDDRQTFAPGVFDREIVPHVGTIYRYHERHLWPDAAIVALFPGYIASRWNPETNATEYRADESPATEREAGALVAAAQTKADRELWRFAAGTRVDTPLGPGTVSFQRMAPPDYRRAEAPSVRLDHDRSGYQGTVFSAADVRRAS
jgi:hypothetical protein